MPEEDDFEKREAGTRVFLRKLTQRAIDLRSKDREFHGLEREFLYHQAQMLVDYGKTRDIKHPRDVGTAREQILRKFLTEGGYLPKRYAVSDRSVRVVSTTGHISNEIDIALYDPIDSLTLMNREDVYEVHPIESVYGVIQVKSLLTNRELQSGLLNLASFKKLDRPVAGQPPSRMFRGRQPSGRGFGLLFAYGSDMAWGDVIRELEAYAKAHPQRVWPNAVFILDKGFFRFGRTDRGTLPFNEDIEAINALQIHGYPDREGLCLYQFQSHLLTLLRHTLVHPAQMDAYFRLPLVAEDKSYAFTWGNFAEVGHCEKHGDFARKISPDALATVVSWCREAAPINWIKATDIAYGLPEDEEAYRRQPAEVRIYNPEGRSLSDILVKNEEIAGKPVRSLAFDSIEAAGMTMWLPSYYVGREGLITGCPKCAKQASRRAGTERAAQLRKRPQP